VSAIAETTSGQVRGARASRVVQFLGIPYATAPRFAPPGPVAGWTGVRDALKPGPAAPQPRRPVAQFTHGDPAATDEECLNLNVSTPSLDGRRPVVVWIHGGGFTIGHAAASIYDGAPLAADADAVVVSLNYRLGSLGWLWHPELALRERQPAGNWGLLDQIAALEWVRDNIGCFGGDPARVTLAGQSAGALCAMDLLIASGSQRLFQRAILQSPPIGDVAQATSVAHCWSAGLNELAGGGARFNVPLLRALPAERIVALHEELLEQPAFRGTRGGALPTIDPGTLPRSPVDHPGSMPGVDVLIGTTAEEGTFFFKSPWRPPPNPDKIAAVIGHLPGVTDPAATIERYRSRAAAVGRMHDGASLLVDIATDAIVAEPVARWAAGRAGAIASRGGSVYRYRVDHRGAGPVLGATHTVEVPLLFGTWADGGPGERLGGQGSATNEVAGALVESWTRFIKGHGPGWEAVTAGPASIEVGVFGGQAPFSVERIEAEPASTQHASYI
jgi:para-nitrobenzyl esterase